LQEALLRTEGELERKRTLSLQIHLLEPEKPSRTSAWTKGSNDKKELEGVSNPSLVLSGDYFNTGNKNLSQEKTTVNPRPEE